MSCSSILPQFLIGQVQLLPLPGLSLADAQPSPAPILSLLSGSAAGSHWLRRSARERPLAAGSGPPGSPLSRRRFAVRAAPYGTADGTAPGRNRGTTGVVLSSAVPRGEGEWDLVGEE